MTYAKYNVHGLTSKDSAVKLASYLGTGGNFIIGDLVHLIFRIYQIVKVEIIEITFFV